MTTRSNYADRTSTFKHHMPADLLKSATPSREEFVEGERSKQASKMREWYMGAKESDQANLVTLRSNFSNARSCAANPLHGLERYRGVLVAGVFIAGIVGSVMFFGLHP